MSDQPIEPLNAFRQAYLEAVRNQDDPSTSWEAETAGPFTLVEQNGMLALYRAWGPKLPQRGRSRPEEGPSRPRGVYIRSRGGRCRTSLGPGGPS